MNQSGEKPERTTREVLKTYELYARAAGFSQHRLDQMRSCVGLFDRFLHGIIDIREVKADDFRRFLIDLRDRSAWQGLNNEKAHRLSGTTITTYGRAIKTFFNWSHTAGIIADNPLASVAIPRNPKMLPKVYSEKDLKAVFAAAANSIRDLTIFYLFLDSGIRLSELSGLKMGDVDTQNGIVKVHGKGNKERFVYIIPDVGKCFDRYVKEFRQHAAKGDFLFLTEDGNPLQARGIQALLLRLGKKAGLEERLSPHKLRHTFATLSLKYGGNVEYIKKILGHTDIKTTSEAYLNVQDADVGAAHRHFSPMSNLQRIIAEKGRDSSADAKPEFQPAPQRTLPEWRSYPETAHKREIRKLAEDFVKVFILPLAKDCFIVELRTGRLVLGKEGIPITVDEKGKIRLDLPLAGGGDIDVLQRALFSHLTTAGLSSFLSDINTWREGVADNLEHCHKLFKRVKSEVEDTFHNSIQIQNYGNPGFTMDFPILICADAVEQAGGSVHFKAFPYNHEGLNLKFGGFTIYVGIANEDLKLFENAHRALRSKCAAWPQTMEIAVQRRNINNLATVINQHLQKFIAMEYLPGQCELCS